MWQKSKNESRNCKRISVEFCKGVVTVYNRENQDDWDCSTSAILEDKSNRFNARRETHEVQGFQETFFHVFITLLVYYNSVLSWEFFCGRKIIYMYIYNIVKRLYLSYLNNDDKKCG